MTLYQFEQRLWSEGYQHIAGCDEVGRGPLAGPVVAAAVVLDPNHPIVGLNDSKQLSKTKRRQLQQDILAFALAYEIVFLSPEVIDDINIYQASKQAMMQAIKQLDVKVDYVLSDAMPLPTIGVPVEAIVKGDTKSATIAAASILAKEARDDYMCEMAKIYPGYGFERNMGYPTKEHKEALETLGPTPIHRNSYKPVQDWYNKQMKLNL